MRIIKKRAAALGLVAIVLVWAMVSLFNVEPAPYVQAAVITPIAQTGRGNDEARVAQFFVSKIVIADTRICFDLKDYETMDIQYAVDATLANATTVTVQQTNIDPTLGPFNSAQVIATVSTPTDADAMTQIGLFGRWNCVFVDVTNANPETVTIIGVAK